MFRRVENRYSVESDEGFAVARTGSPLTQFKMQYREGPKTLEYPLENLVQGSVTPIVVKLIAKWNPPHDNEPLPLEKKVQIAERINDAIQFLGDKSSVIR